MAVGFKSSALMQVLPAQTAMALLEPMVALIAAMMRSIPPTAYRKKASPNKSTKALNFISSATAGLQNILLIFSRIPTRTKLLMNLKIFTVKHWHIHRSLEFLLVPAQTALTTKSWITSSNFLKNILCPLNTASNLAIMKR